MNRRHRARRLALQGLCCLDVQGNAVLDLVDEFLDDSREQVDVRGLAKRLVREAMDERSACDEILSRHARHWDLRRLALVDRNILRLAVHELRSGLVPFKVAITEAIALAKEFSTAESPRFVNGVLDAVAREIADARQQG